MDNVVTAIEVIHTYWWYIFKERWCGVEVKEGVKEMIYDENKNKGGGKGIMETNELYHRKVVYFRANTVFLLVWMRQNGNKTC